MGDLGTGVAERVVGEAQVEQKTRKHTVKVMYGH